VKVFFRITLLVSILAPVFALLSTLSFAAHNHWEVRHYLLDHNGASDLGLTKEDLSLCPKNVAAAYKASVNDGYKLGNGLGMLWAEVVCLAAVLFMCSLLGLRAVRKTTIHLNQMSND